MWHIGVTHIVFSSVAGADISQPVEHFYTKFKLEEHLRASGLGWTVVRPVGFMEVIPPPGIGRAFFLGAMASLMGNTKQKYVACDDIGKTVAKALLHPADFNHKFITIAGQVADVDELQTALERGEGTAGWGRVWMPRWLVIRLTPYHYRQMFDVSAGCIDSESVECGDLTEIQWLYYENCQPGSIDETKSIVPDLMDIETWARRQQALRATN
jgi:NmrA-like family protein